MRKGRSSAFFIFGVTTIVAATSPWHRVERGGSVALASSQAYSLQDLIPAIEAALGQIERAQRIPDLMAAGPTPPRNDAPVPAIPEPPPVRAEPPPEAADFSTVPPVQELISPPSPEPEAVATDRSLAPERAPRPRPRPHRTPEPVPNSTCSNCSEHVRMRDIRYMECSNRNNYLESELSSMRGRSNILGDLLRRGPRSNGVISGACVRAGLESVFSASATHFASCAAGASRPTSGQRRPCISENYFTLVNNSLDLVSRCMAPYLSSSTSEQQTDIRLLLGLMAQESGLHANARNGSGAAGLGQLVQDSIDAVNRNEMASIRSHLQAQGGDCARLAQDLLTSTPPMRGGTSHACDRISLARGNPALNLIYTFGNLKISKRALERSIFEHRDYRSAFAGLSAEQRNRLRTSIVVWSHNTGVGGMQTPLRALLNSTYRGRRITDVDRFLTELSQAHRDYPHSSFRGRPAVIREKSGYFRAVSSRLRTIETNAGSGSCVNL